MICGIVVKMIRVAGDETCDFVLRSRSILCPIGEFYSTKQSCILPNMTQALQEICEIELIYRNKKRASDRPSISCSKDAYYLFHQNWDDCKINLVEQFKIMLLDRSNKLIGISEVSTGGVHATVVDPKIVFAIALKGRACSLILAHNHPSGNLAPSPLDIQLTNKLCEGGKHLDISILDHLIITDFGYSSISDRGFIPK